MESLEDRATRTVVDEKGRKKKGNFDYEDGNKR